MVPSVKQDESILTSDLQCGFSPAWCAPAYCKLPILIDYEDEGCVYFSVMSIENEQYSPASMHQSCLRLAAPLSLTEQCSPCIKASQRCKENIKRQQTQYARQVRSVFACQPHQCITVGKRVNGATRRIPAQKKVPKVSSTSIRERGNHRQMPKSLRSAMFPPACLHTCITNP